MIFNNPPEPDTLVPFAVVVVIVKIDDDLFKYILDPFFNVESVKF